ncbi:hypothetical protein [Curvibacter phage PCA1]|nr:hypothetical protein [Curvibacter phage PCA1]
MISTKELDTIESTITTNYSGEILTLATASYFASNLLTHYGNTNGVSLIAQIDVIEAGIEARCRELGIPIAAIRNAKAAIIRAGQTADLLNSIPD